MRWRKLRVRPRVTVNLLSGTAITGVVISTSGPLIAMRDAVVHESAGSAPADGEIIVDKSNVDFIQAVGG